MKTFEFLKWTLVCALGVFTMASCDDDDDDFRGNVPGAVQQAFNDKYGGVGRVEWDRESGGYFVAEFWKDDREHDAWFAPSGEWVMTEVDHGRNLAGLPQAVQDGYAVTTYAQPPSRSPPCWR